MAQDIEVKIKVETDNAVTNIKKLDNALDNLGDGVKETKEDLKTVGSAVDMEPSIANLKKLKRELMNTAAGTKEFDKLSMSIRDMEDSISDAKKGNDDFLGQMENAPGILGQLGKGIRGAETATSSFGGALKATGIGLIVALLGGLVSAFSGNESAMKKIQPLFDGLKKITYGIFRAVEPLVDIFLDLAMKALPYVTDAVGMVYSGMMAYFTFLKEAGGGAMKILKGVFTLDGDAISAGIDQVSGSFGKATDTYKKSMKAFGEGTKELTDSEKEALEKKKELLEKQKEAQDKANEKAKAAREKAAEEAKAAREKEAQEIAEFNQKIADLEKSKYDQLRDISAKSEQEKLDLQAQRDLEAIEELRKQGADVTKLMQQHNEIYTKLDQELQDKLGKEKYAKDKAERQLALENEMNDLDTSFQRKREIVLQQEAIALEDKTLTEQQKIQIKQKAEQEIAAMDAEKAQKDKDEKLLAIENQLAEDNVDFETQRELVNEREALLLEDKTLTDEQRVAIHKATADAQQEIDEKKAKATQDILNAVSQSMDIASDLLGKNTVAGKALAVASALMNTYQGITAGVKLGYPMSIPAVAMAAITGFKAVKNILSTKIPGKGGGGSASINTPSSAMPSPTIVKDSGVNQLASTLKDQPPVKAFVVANDVTTRQSLDRNIVKTASLG
jgi:hypothetical protein